MMGLAHKALGRASFQMTWRRFFIRLISSKELNMDADHYSCSWPLNLDIVNTREVVMPGSFPKKKSGQAEFIYSIPTRFVSKVPSKA